ncbi:Lrp/AsnC family transcriptional regulator [Pseudoflavonifractor phocaeensis]|uniref:Lrp/AsnC family transcriptional regulator n=1 Tax=Pseudoflavonifractor phocaeensis TaxID=1870988 RepID=UPI0025A354C4|nr:Lrp/AsnC family transcriptional regulator [Pseudoflavonifractor phocaeensis]MDM8237864.1 Lrp/AsnC family transcriptional regulator [Pseudoflavonifractor phocaeensis]
MDQIDEKIIDILQKNGRISMQKLAKELPMSVPATCDRVKKLEDAGVITGYTATVDFTKLGKTVNAFILCSLRIGELESNIRWARRTPQIVAAYTIAGRYSLLLQVACKDMAEYQELINTLYTCSVVECCIIIKEIKSPSQEELE